MIKKLLGLGVVLLSFIGGYSNAYTQVIGLEGQPSYINSNFSLTFLKGGGFISNFLGTSKSVLALDSDVLFWWAKNGSPYFYSPNFQGFFGEYWGCDAFGNGITTPTNCVLVPYDYTDSHFGSYLEFFPTFFGQVKQGDIAYYDYYYENVSTSHGYVNVKTIEVCFSSQDIGKSICFRYSTCRNQNSPSYCNGREFGSLTGSQLLTNLNFSNIPYSYLGSAPGQVGYGNESGIEAGYVENMCPTVGELLKKYDSSVYNTGLCYGPSTIYSGGSFQTITPSSIFELFTDYNEYKEKLSLFANYCDPKVYQNNSLCEQAFSGQYLQYVYIANLNNLPYGNFFDRYSDYDLYQYCNLSLNFDPNTTTCVGSGVLQGGDQITNNDVLNSITNSTYNPVLPVTGLVNGNTTVYNTFSNQYKSEYSGDAVDQINNLFVKFTSLFVEQKGSGIGFLPDYIILAFLGIILFKLFKK